MEPYLPKLSEPALRWVRLAASLVALGLLCWVAYRLRTVFTPLVAAAAIAYVLNPAVTWFETARGVPRLATVAVAFALLGALVIGGGFYLGSKTIAQVAEFQQKAPVYVQTVGEWVSLARTRVHGEPPSTATSSNIGRADGGPASSPTVSQYSDGWQWVGPLVTEHGVQVARSTLSYIGSALANLANLVALLVLIPVFTFYFLWRFNDFVRALHDYLPAAYRDGIVHVVRTIDAAVADFFRGRLIVCLAVGALTGIGWSLVGVPYSLPLGVLAGILNLVPFLSLLALPPALLFAYLGATEADAPWIWPVIWTMGVYLGAQALDSFVLGPLILGRSAGLHPLAIVVALLVGAELAGVLGLLLAIPVASTLKTLAAELLLPELRRLADRSGAKQTPG